MRWTFFPPKPKPENEGEFLTRGRLPPKASPVLGDRMKPTVDRRVAEAAKLMLDNEAVAMVLDRMRGAAMAEFANSQESDIFGRDQAYRRVKAVDTLQAEIQAMADELKLHPSHDADAHYVGP